MALEKKFFQYKNDREHYEISLVIPVKPLNLSCSIFFSSFHLHDDFHRFESASLRLSCKFDSKNLRRVQAYKSYNQPKDFVPILGIHIQL